MVKHLPRLYDAAQGFTVSKACPELVEACPELVEACPEPVEGGVEPRASSASAPPLSVRVFWRFYFMEFPKKNPTRARTKTQGRGPSGGVTWRSRKREPHPNPDLGKGRGASGAVKSIKPTLVSPNRPCHCPASISALSIRSGLSPTAQERALILQKAEKIQKN